MKISLTRLLNEIKLTNKKIDKKTSENINYFDIEANGRMRHYKSKEDMKAKVDSHLNSVNDLIKLRDKYRRILLKANNETFITIGKERFTIAETIAKKDVIDQEVDFLNKILAEHNDVLRKVMKLESDADLKLDDLVRTAIGKDIKNSATEINDITKVFRDNNKVSVVDPSGSKKLIEKRREEVEDFINNIDFALSEINAKTEVELD